MLSRIYTRTGDDGTTALGDGSRAAKTDPRLAAYADVDEANCAIGMAITLGALPGGPGDAALPAPERALRRGRRPVQPGERRTRPIPRCGSPRTTSRPWKQDCDAHNAGLPALRSFILPSGSPGAALLHLARTVVRRAERSTWAALETYSDSMNPLTARYLNRLSDLLFILAREANGPDGDVLWKPGGER